MYIFLEDYINFYQDEVLLDSKICNQLFKKQWSLPNILQYNFLLKKLETYLLRQGKEAINISNKINPQQISNDLKDEAVDLDIFEYQINKEQDMLIKNPFLTDLQNLLNIVLSNNLNQNVIYELHIRTNGQNMTNYYTFQDQEYSNIYSKLINLDQVHLLLIIKNSLNELNIKFMQVNQNIFIIFQEIYHEVKLEEFSLKNFEKMIKRIAYMKEICKQIQLQKFGNLKELSLNLTRTIDIDEQMQLFKCHENILVLEIKFQDYSEIMFELINQVRNLKKINTLVISQSHRYAYNQLRQKQFNSLLYKLKKVVVVKKQYQNY
ncbi:hypothetical protein TTHERM_001462177 (macronuclear) [Tetrahymena thermophila SB210]|uniref:Uncharacterized protein n=1 Tax=Tetrahymena thermophila (strain SB210) TaxID=312017 RepID=W7X1S2_TETTS|nr:hypothetical protein TTHERM_001462177 [Tetrahymena thermophila SB210]EWS71572.1 hypothetical protein TTHERM_001462177 [Tetrahymena thermophila SB210]|eukprot:XP_012655894.1 hypothetical protein TTHERM_001462177 [Tetrahymena thermophila SB210]